MFQINIIQDASFAYPKKNEYSHHEILFIEFMRVVWMLIMHTKLIKVD